MAGFLWRFELMSVKYSLLYSEKSVADSIPFSMAFKVVGCGGTDRRIYYGL
jgi:hypothetical protein